MKHPLPDMLENAMSKIRTMADANTMMGEPIVTPEGVTIIPVSRVKYGFAGGGTDFATKSNLANLDKSFGGGTGGSVSITPVAFLVIKGENVRLLPVAEPASNSVDRLIELIPEAIDQISGLLKKKPEETDA